MDKLNSLQSRFPNINFVLLDGGYGCNCYLPNCVVTVYWAKKFKYGISTTNKWAYYSDLNDFMNILERLINPPKKEAVIVKEAVKSDIGTQACIDHLKRKVALMQAGNGNNNTIMMLKQLVIEFEQYL